MDKLRLKTRKEEAKSLAAKGGVDENIIILPPSASKGGVAEKMIKVGFIIWCCLIPFFICQDL